jgi:hypothetical protein
VTATLCLAGCVLWLEELPFVPEDVRHWSSYDLKLDAVFGLSLITDIAFLAALRWTLRWLIRKPNTKAFLTGLTLQICIIGLFVALPWAMGDTVNKSKQLPDNSVETAYTISDAFVLFGLNTATGIAGVSFLALLLLMSFHKLLWPVLSRMTHPLARFELVRNRKVMIGIGIICIAVISPPVADLLKKILEMF